MTTRLRLDQGLTINLATRSRVDIIRFLDPFTHPALDAREDLAQLLEYFDDYASFNGLSTPSSLMTKFDTAIPRCVYCLASPATEKLDGLLQPGARPSFRALVARLLRRKAAVNADAWLHQHYRNYHFTCCQEHPCSDMDTFAICQVEHILAQKDAKVPKHVPTFGVVSFYDCLETAARARMPGAPADKQRILNSVIEHAQEWSRRLVFADGSGLVGDGCFICGRKDGTHNARICSEEARQVVLPMFASLKDPAKYTVKAMNRCVKTDRWIGGCGSLKRKERRHFVENNSKMVAVECLGRMMVTALALEHEDVPVGNFRLWHLAYDVIVGKQRPNMPVLFKSMEVFGEAEDIAALADDVEYNWTYWRNQLLAVFQRFKNTVPAHLVTNVTMGPLYRDAETTAVNLGTKMRGQLASTIWRLLAAHLRVVQLSSPFLRMRGVFGKVLALLKRFVIANADPQDFHLEQITSITADELNVLEQELADVFVEVEEVEDVNITQQDTLELIRELLHNVGSLLRGIPLCRLVDVKDKDDSRLPRPLTSWERWAFQTGIEKTADSRALFHQLTPNQQAPFTAGVKEDWTLFVLLSTLIGQRVSVVAPSYTFMTPALEHKLKHDGEWKVFHPAYLTGQDNQVVEETSTQPSTLASLHAMALADTQIQAIVDHVLSGKKGLPGVSTSALFKIYLAVQRASEDFNDVYADHNHEDGNPSHVTAQWKKLMGEVEKKERLAGYGFDVKVPRVPGYIKREWNAGKKTNRTKRTKPIRLSEPVIHISFEPRHFVYDWSAYREFLNLYFDWQVPKTSSWSHVIDSGPMPFVDLRKLKKSMVTKSVDRGTMRKSRSGKASNANRRSIARSTVQHPMANSTRYSHSSRKAKVMHRLITDGFDEVFAFVVYEVVLKDQCEPEKRGWDINSEDDREKMMELRDGQQTIEIFTDPGRREIEVMLIPLGETYLNLLRTDSTTWSPLDRMILSKNAQGQVVTEVFDHTNGVIKKNLYKSNVAIPSDTPWRAPCLVNGSAFLVRTLPLSEYYRVIGFKKLEDDRKKARANWVVHGTLTMDTWYKTLPSQRTTRSNTLDGLYKAMVSSMESILGFHSANLKFRAAKLRLFHKRNNCLSSLVDGLVWNGLTRSASGRDCIVYHGAATFSQSSRGLPSGPGKLIRRLISERTNLVLIDEYNTSKKCCVCRQRDLVGKSYLKAGESAAKDLTWGVKRCWKCRITFNRDINACFNIGFVAWFQLYNDGRRPEGYFKPKRQAAPVPQPAPAQVPRQVNQVIS